MDNSKRASTVAIETAVFYVFITIFLLYKLVKFGSNSEYLGLLPMITISFFLLIKLKNDFDKKIDGFIYSDEYKPSIILIILYDLFITGFVGIFSLYVCLYKGIWGLINIFRLEQVEFNLWILFFRILCIGIGFSLVKKAELLQRMVKALNKSKDEVMRSTQNENTENT